MKLMKKTRKTSKLLPVCSIVDFVATHLKGLLSWFICGFVVPTTHFRLRCLYNLLWPCLKIITYYTLYPLNGTWNALLPILSFYTRDSKCWTSKVVNEKSLTNLYKNIILIKTNNGCTKKLQRDVSGRFMQL